MRNISPILTIVAAALLLPAAATAQDATDGKPNRAERRQRMIEQFDADGDGQLNEEERAKARAERGNQSGKAGRKSRGGGGRQGQAGRPRGPPDPMQLFDRFDENDDGQLSREEFMKLTTAMREMRERRGAGSQPDPRRAGRDGRRGPPRDRGDRDRFRPLQNPDPQSRRDDQRGFRGRDDERGARDRRGPASRGSEQMGPPNPERLFNAFDANGDDQLSREEFMQLTAAMRERMGRGGRQGFRRGPPEESRPKRSRRPDRPERPRRPPPEFESVEPTEPAADDNSA